MQAFWIVVYYGLAYHLPHRYFPLGTLCSRFRAFVVKQILGEACGVNLELEGQVLFGAFRDVRIGSNVQINERARLRNITIGDNVMIAPEVYVLHGGHSYDRADIPMRFQGETAYPTTVLEDDVWIGARALIMPGRRVGHGSIVAAGAVVVKDVEPCSIVGGNPAVLIGKRAPCVA